jgi:hypothetical protein
VPQNHAVAAELILNYAAKTLQAAGKVVGLDVP